MPRVTQAHLDARQRQILTAAHSCFARHGFHGTTMQEVADEAGLSVGAIYRYFGGKEALIEALAAWGREQKRQALEELRAGEGAEGLGRMVEEILSLLANPEAAMAVRLDVRLWGESLGQPALAGMMSGGLDELRKPIASYLRKELKGGRLRADVDPEGMARTVVGLIAGIELQKAVDPDLELGRVVRTIRTLIAAIEA